MQKMIFILSVTIILNSICFAQKAKNDSEKVITDSTKAIIDINNIKLPLDNRGSLADTYPYNPPHNGGSYDDIEFLFSSGFFISGKSNIEVWTNGLLSTSRIEDYLPGPVGSNPKDIKNKLYIVKNSDAPFGVSWIDWQYAVSLGAKFYDGNNDGIYNPIDFNNNGLWDSFEDRPDIQGDLTAWCVYNDSAPLSLRRFSVNPQGIEIKQSVFALNGEGTHFEDIIFIRYEIANTGSVAEVFDSVYFAPAADPDLGYFNDDLLGCDTIHSIGYVYNRGPDDEFGNNPPAFLIKQLQGPPVFIAGETYIDHNLNGQFDLEVDAPLDSAFVNRGKYLGSEFIPGAKNLQPNAFTQFKSAHPTHGDFDTHFELRNYMIGGMGKNGDPLDPCTFNFGNGASLPNCNEINPKFMYSGDPVLDEGWLNSAAADVRFILSTGPFQLEVGKPVELIYAYIVGRGTDHLNSITVAREISQFAQEVYDNNFIALDSLTINNDHLLLKNFELFQNYPNPFNQSTTIKYTIPFSLTQNGIQEYQVQIKIFDILGREIKTLINEQKPAGTYEVQFDASSISRRISSGVYFYQLNAGSFVQTKKLMLIK